MTLTEYYRKLASKPRPLTPAQKLVVELSRLTGKTPKTVRQWMYGTQEPCPEDKELISKKLGMTPSELFPQNKIDNGKLGFQNRR